MLWAPAEGAARAMVTSAAAGTIRNREGNPDRGGVTAALAMGGATPAWGLAGAAPAPRVRRQPQGPWRADRARPDKRAGRLGNDLLMGPRSRRSRSSFRK